MPFDRGQRHPSRFVKKDQSSITTALLAGLGLLGVHPAMASAEVPLAEELVDMVVQHCQAGQAQQAQAISQAIREQLSPPPEILALLAQITQTGCRAKPQGSQGPYTEIALSVGFDDNINQGVSADSVTLGSAIKPITLVLDGDYKPVSQSYLAATATRQITTDNGWTLRGTAGLRQLRHYSQLDTAGVHLTGRYALQPLGVPSSVLVGWSQTWLGGAAYRRVPSIEWQSLLGNAQQPWVVNGQIQQLSHDTVPSQNARITTVSATRFVRWSPQSLVSWGGGLLRDQALGQRAGGDRQGHTLQASAQHRLPQGQLQAQWVYARWASAHDFSPGLVDHPRQNQTTQLSLSYQKNLSEGASLYVEYQRRIARDNVPLYAHTSNGLVAGWIQQWK